MVNSPPRGGLWHIIRRRHRGDGRATSARRAVRRRIRNCRPGSRGGTDQIGLGPQATSIELMNQLRGLLPIRRGRGQNPIRPPSPGGVDRETAFLLRETVADWRGALRDAHSGPFGDLEPRQFGPSSGRAARQPEAITPGKPERPPRGPANACRFIPWRKPIWALYSPFPTPSTLPGPGTTSVARGGGTANHAPPALLMLPQHRTVPGAKPVSGPLPSARPLGPMT